MQERRRAGVPRASVAALAALLPLAAAAADAPHFDPDADPSHIAWSELAHELGPAPDVRGQRFGVVLKTLTNEYWRLMAAGDRKRAAADGVKLDIQAAQSESDPIQQLAIMETMVGSGYKGLLISPQSDSNLQSAIDDAILANVPLVDVDGAVSDGVMHFVGPQHRRMGVAVAEWFVAHEPAGGKVAVIEGQPGMFSTVRRTAGFSETLAATGKFEVVASISGQWDRGIASEAARVILAAHSDLIGIYCNNDTMALGVVEVVKALHRLDRVKVFGSDGTRGAYASIEAGDLTGTVDIFPGLIGALGLDIAERLSTGQTVPRVVETPQALVTRETLGRYGGSDDAVQRALMEDAATAR